MPTVRDVCSIVAPALALLLCFSIFSLYTVLMKKAINDGSNPITLAFLREILATSILIPAAWWTQHRKANPADRLFWPLQNDYGHFVLLGAAMIWGTQLLSALALQHITATNYSLLAPSVPVFTLAIALITRYEHFDRFSAASWLKVGSIATVAGGALYIAAAAAMAAGSGSVARSPILGNIFLLTNKLCVSSYPILEKALLKRYDPLVIVAWGYATGAALTLMSVVPCATDEAAWHITPSGWGAIAYSGVLSSAFNYGLMVYVNKHTSPVFVMAAYPWQSIATPVLAFLILGAPFGANDAIGGTIILGGLAMCVYARWMEGRHVASGSLGSANGHHKLVEVGAGVESDRSSGDSAEAAGMEQDTPLETVTIAETPAPFADKSMNLRVRDGGGTTDSTLRASHS